MLRSWLNALENEILEGKDVSGCNGVAQIQVTAQGRALGLRWVSLQRAHYGHDGCRKRPCSQLAVPDWIHTANVAGGRILEQPLRRAPLELGGTSNEAKPGEWVRVCGYRDPQGSSIE